MPTTRFVLQIWPSKLILNRCQVAKKTFVDNITRQVIERHIVAKLADAFNPITVSCYSDEELVDLATVPPKIGHRRSEMYRVQRTLKQSFRDLAER